MKVWKYGDNVDTDQLFPGKYTYTCATAEEIKPHLLEDLDPLFAQGVTAGDVIMAGRNFGCGSSREQPGGGIEGGGRKGCDCRELCADFLSGGDKSGIDIDRMSREGVKAYKEGDEVILDVEKGTLTVGGKGFSFPSLPAEILAIREAGGLLAYTRSKLKTGF